MARDSNGNYTLPLAAVVTATTITSAWGNTTTADIAVELTDSLSRSGKGGMTAVFEIIPGTVGAPGLSINNEVTTGFYRISSGVLGLSILGVAVMDWRAATINMAQKLVVADATDSTTGGTGSIHTAGGIGAVKDIVTDAGLKVSGISTLVGDATHGGDVLSDSDGTDSIGSTGVRWLKGWFDSLGITGDVGAATGTFSGEVTAAGFTGTLDGILGGGTPAVADVTTLTASGIVRVDDTTESTSGTTGSLQVDGGLGVAKSIGITGDIVFGEKADHTVSSPLAGKGYLWAKSTSPTTLIFTDDTGQDLDLTLPATGGGNATTVTVADESADTTCFILFATGATGNLAPKSGSNLTFNSDTGLLTATTFVGALTGVASGNALTSHTHAAADVVSGAFADARIPSLNASKINAGIFVAARVATHTGDVTGQTALTAQAALISGKTDIASGIAGTDELLLNDAGALKRFDLNNLISGQASALTTGLVATDELLVSDAGLIKRMDVSVIKEYLYGATVADHIRAGNTQLWDGSNISPSAFGIDSTVTKNTWESIGPTGSGADNIWSAMDVIPSNATVLIVWINLTLSTSGSSQASILVNAVYGDDSTPAGSFLNYIGRIDVDVDAAITGNHVIGHLAYIPLGPTNQDFKCFWTSSNEDVAEALIAYRGFITDS